MGGDGVIRHPRTKEVKYMSTVVVFFPGVLFKMGKEGEVCHFATGPEIFEYLSFSLWLLYFF